MFTFDLTGVSPGVGPVTLSIVGSQGNFQPTFTTTAQITVTLDYRPYGAAREIFSRRDPARETSREVYNSTPFRPSALLKVLKQGFQTLQPLFVRESI